MKIKIVSILLYTAVLCFYLTSFLLITGCETEVDEAWSGFGGSDHFAAPHEGDHVGFLVDNPYVLDNCQECHGADYNGGSSGISCIGCHAVNNVENSCNRCHGDYSGDPDDPVAQAPPMDVAGNTSTGEVTVGAHTFHLTGTDYSDGIECLNCHTIPGGWYSDGHMDADPSEVVFDGIADRLEHNPVWDRNSATCSDTYCHGDFAPVWTTVDGSQASCGTCHQLPPPAPHYNSTLEQCVWCHSSVVDVQGNIIDKALHINGVVNN